MAANFGRATPTDHSSVTVGPAWSERIGRAWSEAGRAESTTASVAGRADWKQPRCSTVNDCWNPRPLVVGAKDAVGSSLAEHVAPGGGHKVPPNGVYAPISPTPSGPSFHRSTVHVRPVESVAVTKGSGRPTVTVCSSLETENKIPGELDTRTNCPSCWKVLIGAPATEPKSPLTAAMPSFRFAMSLVVARAGRLGPASATSMVRRLEMSAFRTKIRRSGFLCRILVRVRPGAILFVILASAR